MQTTTLFAFSSTNAPTHHYHSPLTSNVKMRKGSGTSGGAGLYHNLLHHPHLQHHQNLPHLQHLHQQHQLHLQLQQHQQQQQSLQHHSSSSNNSVTTSSSGGGGGGGVLPSGILPPHLHNQQQQFTQHSSMVQQRANQGGGGRYGGGGGGGGGGNHPHHHTGNQGGNPYLHGAGGIILPHHLQGHLGGGPPHLVGGVHQMHGGGGGGRPIIPHGGAGFGNLPSGMGQGMNLSGSQYGGNGPVASGINSHFGGTGGGGGGSGGGVSSNSSHSSGGGGDLPPVETVVARLETACRLLHGIGGNNTRVVEISGEIQILSEDLRRVGAMLENTYPEVLDRLMSSMRDASAQPCLPPSLRLAIFELVELRASKWILPSDSSNYYRQRRNLNDASAPEGGISEEHSSSGRNSSASGGGGGGGGTGGSGGGGGGSTPVTVVVTPSGSGGVAGASGVVGNNNSGNAMKQVEVMYGGGGGSGGANSSSASSVSPSNLVQVDLDTPPQPQPAKTYREEIVIKNSDSGKVAPTAKERVLSINGYSQQSINLAKQLIQETITRNASPVLDGMVLPSTSSSTSGGGGGGGGGDFSTSEISGALGLVEEAELLGLSKRGGVGIGSGSGSGGGGSPHHHHSPHSSSFSYTVTLGDHSIKILGDDLQYVQEAKMALDDYFLGKYPDLFCANSLNGIEEGEGDEDEEDDDDDDEDFQDGSSFQRYDRQTLLSLSKVRTPPPDFSHLEADVRGTIVLEKPRQFDADKFAREGKSSGNTASTAAASAAAAAISSTPGTPTTPTSKSFNANTNSADVLPG